MSPGSCSFAFANESSVRIRCTTDVSSASTIPSTLLSGTYFTNVTRIDFGRRISSLPSYVCSLPSKEINLNSQAFTTLTESTFPCLDRFRTVSLAANELTSVNMPGNNFVSLTSLDLSLNKLTSLPYSILARTPSSLRYVDLRNNSIPAIDLMLYTLTNITIDLRGNPVNRSTIINPSNVTLPAGSRSNSSANIILSESTNNVSYTLDDRTALDAGACNRLNVLELVGALRLSGSVLLDCSCASINLKQIFARNGSRITDEISCSDATLTANFNNLTIGACGTTAISFSAGLCFNESLQVGVLLSLGYVSN
jgi:hypothetical protein